MRFYRYFIYTLLSVAREKFRRRRGGGEGVPVILRLFYFVIRRKKSGGLPDLVWLQVMPSDCKRPVNDP